MRHVILWLLIGQFSLAFAQNKQALEESKEKGTNQLSAPTAPRTPKPSRQSKLNSNSAALNQTISDKQLVAYINVINNQEMELGKLALDRGHHPDVRNFAKQKLEDHVAAHQKITDIVTTFDIRAQESELSRRAHQDLIEIRDQLSELNGEAFDRSYVKSQLKTHQDALRHLELSLKGQPENSQIALYLKTVLKPRVEAHLRQAESLMSKIN